MKKKIITLLKPKIASKGFSSKTIEGLADVLVKNLEDDATDEDIEGEIEKLMPYAELMQAENTRYANSLKKSQEQNPKGKEGKDDSKEDGEAKPTGNSEIDKLTKLITGLSNTVNGLVQNQTKQSLQQKWKEAAGKEGVDNEKLLAKWMPDSEEGFENALTELKSFAEEFSIKTSNSKSTGRASAGGKDAEEVSAADKKKGSAALDAWSKEHAPAEAKTESK